MTDQLHDVPVAILRRALTIIGRTWPATYADEPVLSARAALQSALGSTGGERPKVRTLEHGDLLAVADCMTLITGPAERKLDATTVARALMMIVGPAPEPGDDLGDDAPGPLADALEARARIRALHAQASELSELITKLKTGAVRRMIADEPLGLTTEQIADRLVASGEFDPYDLHDGLVDGVLHDLEKNELIRWRGKGLGWQIRADRANPDGEVSDAHGPDTEAVDPSHVTETTHTDSQGTPVRAERANPVAAGFLAALQLAVTGDPGPLARLLADALERPAPGGFPYRVGDTIHFTEHLDAAVGDVEEFGVTPAVEGVSRIFVLLPQTNGGRKARYFLEPMTETVARVYYDELRRLVRKG